MKYARWSVGIAVVVLSLLSGATLHASDNQQSSLHQTIQPITCVYTITALGESTSSSTDCDSVIAPTLDIVEARAGRPYLAGTLTTIDLNMFRVWIGGVWFTDGVSNYIDVENGAWELDLAELAPPLESGEYTIVLEVYTTSNFLLRSVYPGALHVPAVELIRTDTVVGDGTTSYYATSGGIGLSSRDRTIASGLMPDDKLIDESWGFTHYTHDTVVPGTAVLGSTLRYFLATLVIVAFVYVIYILPRFGRIW